MSGVTKIFDSLKTSALVDSLIKQGQMSLAETYQDAQSATADEVFEIGNAVVARGAEGALELNRFLEHSSDEAQLIAASWLLKIDSTAALPTLERLKRESSMRVGSSARLAIFEALRTGLLLKTARVNAAAFQR